MVMREKRVCEADGCTDVATETYIQLSDDVHLCSHHYDEWHRMDAMSTRG